MRELPEHVHYQKNYDCYRIRYRLNNREYTLATSKSLEDILDKHEKIKKLIDEFGIIYAWEHRKDFQRYIPHEGDMKNIEPRKKGDLIFYKFATQINKHNFVYSNRDLKKVQEVRDYYFEHGEQATIEKFNLYRNVENYAQVALNYYEGRTLNARNTSGVTGVSYDKRRREWVAQIAINKKHYHLGWFKNKEDAVRAREMANSRGVEWYRNNKLKENKENV